MPVFLLIINSNFESPSQKINSIFQHTFMFLLSNASAYAIPSLVLQVFRPVGVELKDKICINTVL